MKTIKNKSFKPLKLTFSGGKVLYLGPGKTGQIPDAAILQKSIQALIGAATLEVMDGGPAHSQDGGGKGSAPHETTRGHKPGMSTPTKSQRGG